MRRTRKPALQQARIQKFPNLQEVLHRMNEPLAPLLSVFESSQLSVSHSVFPNIVIILVRLGVRVGNVPPQTCQTCSSSPASVHIAADYPFLQLFTPWILVLCEIA